MIYVNGVAVNTTVFPDNTSQVWKLPVDSYKRHVSVVWKFSHEGEVMQLAQLKALLDYECLTADLDIEYLPYGRQDKHVSNDATFALRVFANILNDMEFPVVHIQDPHSEAAIELIKNSYAYYPRKELAKMVDKCKSDLVCYPDSGAARKYGMIYDYAFVECNKVRNQATGEITGVKLIGTVEDQVVLIVDDICDGGRTFIEVAKVLYEAGAKRVDLFVTHGLFTKGLRPLRDADIIHVYTPKGEVLQSDFQKGI